MAKRKRPHYFFVKQELCYEKKAILLFVIALACAGIPLVLFSGRPMRPFLVKDLEQVTCTEYTAEGAVSREIAMSDQLEYDKHQLIYRDDIEFRTLSEGYRSTGKKPAEPEEYLLLKFICTDKQERLLKVFESGKWNYIEEFGVGIWRKKIDKDSISDFRSLRKASISQECQDFFFHPLADGKSPMLHPDYNGGEKLVWIDEGSGSWDLTGIESSTGRPWDRITPDGYKPERAAEVRYVFDLEQISHTKTGEVVEWGTGRKVADHYSDSDRFTAYDLVTGESEILSQSGDLHLHTSELRQMISKYLGLEE